MIQSQAMMIAATVGLVAAASLAQSQPGHYVAVAVPPGREPAVVPGDRGVDDLSWHTVDGGGGQLAGANFVIDGTAGQFDTAVLIGGIAGPEEFALESGFWAPIETTQADCYANCDFSTLSPVLNVADFTCFLQRFAAQEVYANCDNSTEEPVLNVADFSCFLQQFAAGCPG